MVMIEISHSNAGSIRQRRQRKTHAMGVQLGFRRRYSIRFRKVIKRMAENIETGFGMSITAMSYIIAATLIYALSSGAPIGAS